MDNTSKKLKEAQKRRSKKERFLRSRMWFSTLLSYIYPDRNSIPSNIGNNIFVGNNQIMTKNSITEIIAITEFSLETPVALTSLLTERVKKSIPGVRLDFVFKTSPYRPDLNASGLESRKRQWARTLDNPKASKGAKERAARLLHSVDIAESGEQLFKVYTYVYIRATNGVDSRRARELVVNHLTEAKIRYKIINTDIQSSLSFISLLSSKVESKIRDIKYSILSSTNIAELMPTTQGLNSKDGVLLGMDVKNKAPYLVDFKSTAQAKNIYVIAPSGKGKTFLCENWNIYAYVVNYNICIMDLKGTEFSTFTKACNGVTLSLRAESTQFVNTFKLRKEKDINPVVYFNTRFALSKQQLLIMSQFDDDDKIEGEALIIEFLKTLYSIHGVSSENPNSWERSQVFNPYYVYNELAKFLKPKGTRLAKLILERVGVYMSKQGSESHMYANEFSIEEVLEARVLTFDFGLLNSSREPDTVMFKLKVLFMTILNNEFVRYKKSKGEWTLKILEESQIADDYLLELYTKEVTLRRAQNQVTVVLGNAVSALASNKKAQAMLENFNMFCIGAIDKESQEYLVKKHRLEKHRKTLESIAEGHQYQNTFLFVNKLHGDAISTLIKAYVPNKVANGKLFKTVDTED